MRSKKWLSILSLIFFSGLLLFFSRVVYGGEVRINEAWLTAAGKSPYKLTKSDTTYVLDIDVTTDGSAFLLGSAAGCPKNVIFDLNEHTITYANMEFTGVPNPGFEEGDPNDPKIPLDWDLTGAHGHAERWDYTKKLFFDNYSLRISNIAGDDYSEEYVLSSSVYLPVAGKYAITAEVQGGPYNVLTSRLEVDGITVTYSTNKVSNMDRLYGGDMSWGLICEFDVLEPAWIRAKIIVGTKDVAKNTYLSVDEVDIRPIDDAASSLNADYKPIGMAGIKANIWNCTMTEIKNGSIIEGRSKAVYSSAILSTGVKKIHDLTIITNGINSSNINAAWNGNMEIYNNYMEANGKLPLNRQYPFSMIALDRTPGGNKIYNNTLLNGPHVGINHGDATGGVLNPYKSEIYNNVIKLNIIATNGFSMAVGSNVDVHDNIIQPFHGHGIGLLRSSSEVRIYNNLIEPRTWPCSEYSSYTYPNSAHGIRIKNYGAGAISNLEIFNNTIIGKTTPQLCNCYTEVSGITNYLQDDSGGKISQNVKIHNNYISVETDYYLQQHAMAYKSMGQGEFYNNTLKSNHIIVEMSDTDVAGAKNYKYFYNNTLIKGENPQGFHTLRYGYGSPGKNLFTDTILQKGADLKDISLGINNTGVSYSENSELSIGWSLNFNVKDNANNALEGALIEIKDKDNNLITQLTTDAQGLAEFELKEYTFLCRSQTNKSYQYFTPYNITVTKEGYSSFSQGINIDQPFDLSVRLNSLSFPLPSDITPPICSNGAPAGNVYTNTAQVDISLTTDENAVCKYSTIPNTAYNSMSNTFAATGAVSHVSKISGLATGGSYTYCVRCSDSFNNINTSDYVISFNVRENNGDINGDGYVNIQDIQSCVNVILGIETNADIVKRAKESAEPLGECNILDLQAIANVILGG